MDLSTCLIHRGPRLNNAKPATVKERLMSKNRQSRNLNKRQGFSKKDIGGYYFDGKKSYTIYIKKNRSYMLQDK
jgi:hypothetical protein